MTQHPCGHVDNIHEGFLTFDDCVCSPSTIHHHKDAMRNCAMSMDQIQEYRCPLSPVGETPMSPAYCASKPTRTQPSFLLSASTEKCRHFSSRVISLLQSPDREPTRVGESWRWCPLPPSRGVPATLSSARLPATTPRNTPPTSLTRPIPLPLIIPLSSRTPPKQRVATATSDLAQPDPPNLLLRLTWSVCGWRRRGTRV